MWPSSKCVSILDKRNGLAIQSGAHSPPVPQMECKSKSKSPNICKNPDFSVLKSSPPQLWAGISISFGTFPFISYGNRHKHTFRPKEAVSAKIDLV